MWIPGQTCSLLSREHLGQRCFCVSFAPPCGYLYYCATTSLCLHPQFPQLESLEIRPICPPTGSLPTGSYVSLTSPIGETSWGTHRGTYTDRGHVCPDNGPACPSRPQHAPSRGSGGSEGAKVRFRAEGRTSPIPVYFFNHVCVWETG